MREGWITDKLSNCIKLKSGDGLTAKKMKPGKYPVFGGNGIAGYHETFNLKGSNIVIGRVGALCGNARFINEEVWLTDNAFKISEFRYNFNLEFLNYLLNYIDLRSYARQAAQPVISNSSLKDVKLYFPKSLQEQQQIVAILDKAFKAIDQAKANIEKNIENAKELFQSKLNAIFSQKGAGWEEKTLKEICSVITDGTHQTPKYFESGYIFLSSKNVTSGKIDWENVKYLDEEQHNKMYSRLAPQINDILLAKNGTTGVAAIVDVDKVFDIYVSLALLRPTKLIFPYYLLHFINSVKAKKQFNKRLKGIGVPNLHLKEIKEVIINFPTSIDKQEEISNYIDELMIQKDLIENLYRVKLESLEELKKSILQKAFAGELTNKEVAV